MKTWPTLGYVSPIDLEKAQKPSSVSTEAEAGHEQRSPATRRSDHCAAERALQYPLPPLSCGIQQVIRPCAP